MKKKGQEGIFVSIIVFWVILVILTVAYGQALSNADLKTGEFQKLTFWDNLDFFIKLLTFQVADVHPFIVIFIDGMTFITFLALLLLVAKFFG